MQTQHPFETLTPPFVQDALTHIGLWGDGRLMALNSYENRVYLAHLDDAIEGHTAVILKFYRPNRWRQAQIAEEHAFAWELQDAEVPVVAPLRIQGQTLHAYEGFWFSVSPRWGGRMPELGNFETLEWIGRLLARLHNVGQTQAFVQRPTMDAASYGHASATYLLGSNDIIPSDLRNPWAQAFERAMQVMAQVAPELCGIGQPTVNHHNLIRLHGDCHPGNVLWLPSDHPNGGPHFVDLDDARMGPAVQDLWMLLEGDRAAQTQGLSALLDGYEQVRPFDRRQLVLIEPLRTLRQIHYSAWLARRWNDPTFPIHFDWFGTHEYWISQICMLEGQTQAMQTEPLWV